MDQKALYKLTYGLYLLTAREDARDSGCIINTAVQVANDPVRISVSVIKGNHTCAMIRRTGVFNVSAITTDASFALFQRFGMQSGRDTDKFAGFDDMSRSGNGLYYLTKAAGMYLSARVVEEMDLGSHVLFIAEVTDGAVTGSAPECTYAHYQNEIKPKQEQTDGKKRWVCSVCGYVYEGESMPDDFLCPLCKHGKEDFVLTGT